MFKYLKGWAGKAVLALSLMAFAVPAMAIDVVEGTESDFVLDAVGDATALLRVKGRGTAVSIFIDGTYAAGNTIVLQRERGSPGSGAFEVVRVANRATLTNGVADITHDLVYFTRSDLEVLRVLMTATGTGAINVQMTDMPRGGQTYASGASHIRLFDDFMSHTGAVDAKHWITDENTAGTVAVNVVALQEGVIQVGPVSTTGNDTDEVCFSIIDVTDFGGLVSDGWTMFETRIQYDVLTGQIEVLLHDEECIQDQVTPFDVDSNAVVFDTGNQADSIGFVHSEEADDITSWTPVAAATDVEAVNADEHELAGGAFTAVDTYVVLRIEVSPQGDGYWFIDGVLVYAEATAVTNTARLIPFWLIDTTAADGGDITLFIDYVDWFAPRPSG